MSGKIRISEPDETGTRYYEIKPSRDYSAGAGPSYGQAAGGGSYSAGSYAAAADNRKRGGGWKALAIILIVFLIALFAGGALYAGTNGISISNGTITFGGGEVVKNDYVACLYIDGTIQNSTGYAAYTNGYNHSYTMNTIDMLMDDDSNVGIIMFINTPGGTVYESDELYLELCEYRKLTGRPVYVVMGSQCTSGGYYISAAADRIYANRNTWTGSIGVTIGNIFDFTELMEQYGIKVKTITSGENKAMGSSFQEMSPEEEAIWQELVDEAYEQFVGVVATGRNLDTDYVKMFADGRIISASQAISYGLVDEYGDMDDAYCDMIKELGLGFYVDMIDYKYVPSNKSFFDLLNGIAGSFSAKGDAASVIELAESMGSEPISYMCEYVK